MRRPKRKFGKDHYGALLLLVLGCGALMIGLSYKIGSLNRMGAGFIPVVFGVLMVMVGVAIGVTATPLSQEKIAHPLPADAADGGPRWRGWLCILGGVLAFVGLGHYGGLLSATFASAFISAMGDRNNTVKGAALLGAALTLFCLIVFHYGLSLQLPLFQWG